MFNKECWKDFKDEFCYTMEFYPFRPKNMRIDCKKLGAFTAYIVGSGAVLVFVGIIGLLLAKVIL